MTKPNPICTQTITTKDGKTVGCMGYMLYTDKDNTVLKCPLCGYTILIPKRKVGYV